jgi:GNAT superfamily N-acetyltransferase
MQPELSIRGFDSGDMPFTAELRDAEGWNQTPAFFRTLLDHQPDGCFVAEWSGSSAGVVTTTIHDRRLAWIGMMLVDSRFRRRGIATALLEQAVAFLESQGVGCIALDATPAGCEVYSRHGFRDAWGLQRWERAGEPPRLTTAPSSVSFQSPAFDREAFGVDRSVWLRRLATTARIATRDGAFALLRPGIRADYLGPVVATNSSDAAEVIAQLIDGVATRLFWDIPDANEPARRLAASRGFEPVRSLLRMTRGVLPLPGRPELQYGIADPATG